MLSIALRLIRIAIERARRTRPPRRQASPSAMRSIGHASPGPAIAGRQVQGRRSARPPGDKHRAKLLPPARPPGKAARRRARHHSRRAGLGRQARPYGRSGRRKEKAARHCTWRPIAFPLCMAGLARRLRPVRYGAELGNRSPQGRLALRRCAFRLPLWLSGERGALNAPAMAAQPSDSTSAR